MERRSKLLRRGIRLLLATTIVCLLCGMSVWAYWFAPMFGRVATGTAYPARAAELAPRVRATADEENALFSLDAHWGQYLDSTGNITPETAEEFMRGLDPPLRCAPIDRPTAPVALFRALENTSSPQVIQHMAVCALDDLTYARRPVDYAVAYVLIRTTLHADASTQALSAEIRRTLQAALRPDTIRTNARATIIHECAWVEREIHHEWPAWKQDVEDSRATLRATCNHWQSDPFAEVALPTLSLWEHNPWGRLTARQTRFSLRQVFGE